MNGTKHRMAVGIPDPLVTDSKKSGKEFGLRVGRAIEEEWFRKSSGTSRFVNNRDGYHRLRQYAMGEQSVKKYKDELAVNGDISYMNLD